MPRPFSRSRLERLGRQLEGSENPDPCDLQDLQTLLGAYTPVLAETDDLVHGVTGQLPAWRIKNTGTIIEKLRRQGGHSLATIHDLAGIRVAAIGGREDQDRTVAALEEAFMGGSRAPRILDRRASPTHGYRAVHVIVYADGFPIEIQVRTWAQHRWGRVR